MVYENFDFNRFLNVSARLWFIEKILGTKNVGEFCRNIFSFLFIISLILRYNKCQN